ncbi:MAG TPA: LptA/OstA family protein [Candidatus Lustribacter sp.]|nr:LptA/OstA family protein [Candidatus Lustribacter sp.]
MTAVTAFVLLAASPSPGPTPASSAAASSGMEMNGYQIETSQTNWNLNSGDFTMPHEVKVTRPGTDARGDHAKGNTKLGTATLIGSVVVHDSGSAPEAKDAGPDYQGPATITADELTIDSKNKSYDARGNVRFVQGNRVGTADRGVLNQLQHTLHLEGNVVLAEGQSTMKAGVVDYNLQTRDVIANGAPMVIREPIPQGSPGPTPSPKPTKKPKK